MASHTKTYTNGYLLERLKIDRLLLHSRLIGMPFKRLGVICSEKYLAVQTTAAIHSKKFSSFRTAAVFNSEFKTFQHFERQRFCTAKNVITFSFSWRFIFRFAQLPYFTEHLSLSTYISKVLLYRCQDICRLFHFHCTKIDEQDAKTKLFARHYSFQLETLWDFGTSKHAFCLLRFHEAVNVTLSTIYNQPISYCYKTDENNYVPTKKPKAFISVSVKLLCCAFAQVRKWGNRNFFFSYICLPSYFWSPKLGSADACLVSFIFWRT